jgi:hypothetical protein
MKKIIYFIVVFATIPCSAQWKGEAWLEVPAYGVHDTTLFESITGGGITSMYRYGPDTNWHTVGPGIDFMQGPVTSFTSVGAYFFASEAGIGPGYRSSDNGASWIADGGGYMCSSGQYVFGVGGGGNTAGIYRGGDSGSLTSWNQVTNFTASVLATMGYHIFATTSSGLYRSTDTGTNWTVASYPLAPPIAFVVLDTIIFGGSSTGNTGLAWSHDSGATWAQITFPHPVTTLCTDGKNLWAGTADSGVYISTDTGQHWRNVSDGLKYFLQVTAMAVFDTMMIVATVSPGSQNYWQAWRPISEMVDTTPSGVVQTQSSDSLSIYPNPATETVTILAGGTSIYGVSVLNVLGESVLDMPNLRESDITLDLSKIPSGTYFLQIETGNGSVLKKVVVQH